MIFNLTSKRKTD